MPDEAPRKQRKTNHTDSEASTQIDHRLAEAIKERTKLHAAVSRLYSAQEKLSRVEQEINSLVQLRQRLDGTVTAAEIQRMPTGIWPASNVSTYAPGADMPAGVGSIPANPRQPKPTTANAGPAVAKEGGFS